MKRHLPSLSWITGLSVGMQKGFCKLPATGTRLFLLVAALCFTTASFDLMRTTSAAELDETRQHRGNTKATLTWDNVTAKSGYLSGVKPEHSLPRRMHCVELSPGQCMEFFVPAHELVRVVSCQSGQLTDRVQIWTSDGSGLYRKHNAASTADGCSLIAAPDQSSISLAKVCRPSGTSGSVCVAVFTSRRTTPQLLDYYRCPISACGKLVEIKDDRCSQTRAYSMLPGGQSRRLQVSGPKRLRIESRLKYGLDVPARQPFWLQIYVDGSLHRVLTFSTQPNRDRRVFVDGCERLVGRREFAYVDIDCGDKVVEIKTTHDAYVAVNAIGLELCRPNLNRSHDFPNWENVQKALSLWDASQASQPLPIHEDSFLNHAPGTWKGEDWNGIDAPMVSGSEGAMQGHRAMQDGELLETALTSMDDPIWDPYLNQQRIAHLARNNRIDHGGLRAYMWMRAIATRHYGDADFGDEISVAELASRIREHTTYTDLLPDQLSEESDLRSIAFVNRQIRSPTLPDSETIIGEQHLPSAVSAIPSASVCRLSIGTSQVQRYQLPENLGASLLRVVIDQTQLKHNACVMVQFDDSQPIELVVSPGDALKDQAFEPGNAAAALSCLSAVHQRYASGTVGGPFAIWNTPKPIVRAATAEFVKPAHVKSIQVWIANCNADSVDLGLQYLDSRVNELPETAFRALNAIATSEGDKSPMGQVAQQEINNDSLPIERLLRTNYDWFASTIQPSSEVAPATEIWTEALLNQFQLDARNFAEQGQWPEAITAWTKIIRHSEGVIRRDAILSRADALAVVGEDLLAIREWRGWLRYSDDPVLQAQSLSRLLETAAADDDMKEMVLSFAAIEAKDNHFTLQLARQFMNNGRHRFALLVLSSMEPSDENQDILLRCSYQVEWWQLFDETVARLHDAESKNLWMGLKSLKLGRYEHARRMLQSGGTEGARWLDHWQSGDRIFGNLTSANPTVRLSALGQWEAWQRNHPGNKVWVNEPLAIRSARQNQLMKLDRRGINFSASMFTQGQRATINLYGPARVRLEIRPIHAVAATEPINDWIVLNSVGIEQRVPIIQNQPSTTTRLQSPSSGIPGQRETVELELEPGLNQFYVGCSAVDFLLRVETLRPEISLPVLPSINATTIASVVKGSFGRTKHVCVPGPLACTDCIRMTCRDRQCRSIPVCLEATPCGCNDLQSARYYFSRLPYGDARDWESRVVPTELPLTITGLDTNYQQAIDLLTQAQAAIDASEKLAAIVPMHQLSQSNPDRQDLRRILDRLMTGTTWTPYRQFDSRAGVHSLSVEGWTPNSPKARVVAALFGDDIGAHVLSGQQQLTLLMNNPEPTEFEIALRRPRLGFSPVGETTVIIEGRSRSQLVQLNDPDKRTVARIQIGAGPRSLQISQANPLVNHYVHVDLNEVMSDRSIVPIDHQKVRMQQRTETYQVATAEEPLKFRISGPALLRIDRLENGVRSHQYLAVEGDRSYALEPSVGTDSALLKIFQVEVDGNVTPALRTALPPEEVASMSDNSWSDQVVQAAYDSVDHGGELTSLDQLALRSPDSFPLTLRMADGTDLGLEALNDQRLGTIAIAGGYVQRDAVEEFNRQANTERFFETQLSRYHYDQWHDRYSANHFLYRFREDGGPSLGLVHEGATSFQDNACDTNACADGWGDFQFNYKAYGFAQFADHPLLESASSTPWSAGVNARITRPHELSTTLHHSPGISLFARTLSEHENGYPSGELDQDVFTLYKSDHRQGLRLSDRLVYQNCLDRRYWISTSLMSNDAELTPDNVGVQVGTDQLLGPLQFQLAYRMTGYLSDNDRKQSSLQNVLYLDMVLETWHSQKRRSELAFSMRNDFSSGRSSIGINFVSFINHSRGYRDFNPGATLFRSIRQERAAKHYSAGR
ncbi:MAG: hypothetical protein WBD20_22155 [Pirellulaceae bacterium]